MGRREIRVWTLWHSMRDTVLRSTALPLLETLASVFGLASVLGATNGGTKS